ncbi:MAG: aminotransferase class I/II-fold pyridoxal phosphate-dependent enzyme [Oscillospiraceae bacterium]
MSQYDSMSREELLIAKNNAQSAYDLYMEKKLSLNMARGKPNFKQLDISLDMFDIKDYIAEGNLDCRNYGVLDGIDEAKELFSKVIDVPVDCVFVGGNSSLNLMYDVIARAMTHGMYNSEKPWCKYDEIKFLCITPGYDRHFAICEHFGIKMINVPMKNDGPDMDIIDRLVENDDTIKGIWCVPKYSNPQGITYSDAVVKRFAALNPKAKDFRIFWDEAYIVHDLDINDCDVLLPIYDECLKNNNEDLPLIFASTSKISFGGAGVAVMGMSQQNIAYAKKLMAVQTIGFDKINQLRHVKYFKNYDGIINHMKKHAQIIKPKFDIVINALNDEIKPLGIGSWHNPKGGYFICFDTEKGCAKRVIELCDKCGVVMTPAGSTYPYHNDPDDTNIRIAPTFPTEDELKLAMQVFCVCVKLATLEKLLG